MLVLDTDHYSEFQRSSDAGERLGERLRASNEFKAITVITVEETLKGWMSQISPHRHNDRGVRAYARFQASVAALNSWIVLPWTEGAADLFDDLRRQRIRVGTLDLRIASIVLSLPHATLLTRNAVDFQRVPGLRFDDWLNA